MAYPDLNDVDSPEDVVRFLQQAAETFRKSQAELQAAWQDESAGKPWGYLATRFNQLAASLERELPKHY